MGGGGGLSIMWTKHDDVRCQGAGGESAGGESAGGSRPLFVQTSVFIHSAVNQIHSITQDIHIHILQAS